MVVILPIPTIYYLKLEHRQRMMAIILFCVGFLVCFAGAARTVYTYLFSTAYDTPWTSFPVWISSLVELNVGIVSTGRRWLYVSFTDCNEICASIPPTRPFFVHYMPGLLGIKVFPQFSKPPVLPKPVSLDSSENSNDTIRLSSRPDIDLERLDSNGNCAPGLPPCPPTKPESQRALFSGNANEETDRYSDSIRYSDLSRTLSSSFPVSSPITYPRPAPYPAVPTPIYPRSPSQIP